jgi:two-component system sensor histidine kinase CpxA
MPTTPDPAVRPMRVRFPLSVKIVLWFLANVAFLIAAGWIFARVQFGLGLDSLLAGRASERLQSMAQILVDEMQAAPPRDWSPLLARFSAAYHVQLALYRNDGKRVAGEIAEPPAEVLARITEGPRPQDPQARQPGQDRPPGEGAPPNGPPPGRDGIAWENPPPFARPGDERPPQGEIRPGDPVRPRGVPPKGRPGFQKTFLHTTAPRLYWVLIRVPVPDRSVRPPMPATLLMATDSLRGGGLLFDFKPWIVAGAAVLALSVMLWIPLVRGITRTLRQMTGAAENIAQGRFEAEVESARADELGRLATALNHMAARLREFFTGQKRFLGDIAHELCSPLARMEMALGILEDRADETQRSYVTDVRDEVRHMSVLVNELLSFSKAGVGGKNVQLKPVPLAELAHRVVSRECAEKGVVVVEIDRALSVMAEPDLLARAIGNVVRNALRYAPPPAHAASGSGAEHAHTFRSARPGELATGGLITISARTRDDDVIITIADCGPGVPEDALHRLLDPFFRPEAARTRETGGSGLGLAIVKSCIEACGGTITVSNRQPHGLQVDLQLHRA